jgi:hypothetical protein
VIDIDPRHAADLAAREALGPVSQTWRGATGGGGTRPAKFK